MATLLHKTLEIGEREDIALFVIPIIWTVFLDGIVGQMHEVVVKAGRTQVKRCAGGAQVSLLKEIDVHVVSECHPHANVKLALVYQ